MKCNIIALVLVVMFHLRTDAQELRRTAAGSGRSSWYNESVRPQHLQNASDSLPKTVLWKPFQPMTIVAQLISGPAAVLTTGLLIMPIAQIVGKNSGWEAGLGVLIIGAGISAFTLPAGIYWGGRMTGGNGSFWWTTTGCILGGTLMALPNIMGLSDDGTGYIRITLGIFIGGIAGYHFSSSAVMSDRTASTTILRHDVDLSIQKWKRTLPQPTVSLTILTLPL